MDSRHMRLAPKASWLLPGALIISAVILITGKTGNLPLLLPLWALTGYGMVRAGQVLSLRELLLLQVLLCALILGMLFGDFQTNGILNRLAHGGVALVLSAILAGELSRYAPTWLAALSAFSLTVALGAGMEVAEAIVSIGDAMLANRFQDTIYDTVANLVGGALGAALWLLFSTKKTSS